MCAGMVPDNFIDAVHFGFLIVCIRVVWAAALSDGLTGWEAV